MQGRREAFRCTFDARLHSGLSFSPRSSTNTEKDVKVRGGTCITSAPGEGEGGGSEAEDLTAKLRECACARVFKKPNISGHHSSIVSYIILDNLLLRVHKKVSRLLIQHTGPCTPSRGKCIRTASRGTEGQKEEEAR